MIELYRMDKEQNIEETIKVEEVFTISAALESRLREELEQILKKLGKSFKTVDEKKLRLKFEKDSNQWALLLKIGRYSMQLMSGMIDKPYEFMRGDEKFICMMNDFSFGWSPNRYSATCCSRTEFISAIGFLWAISEKQLTDELGPVLLHNLLYPKHVAETVTKVTDEWKPVCGRCYGVSLLGTRTVIMPLKSLDEGSTQDRYLVEQYRLDDDGETVTELTEVSVESQNRLFVDGADEYSYMVSFEGDRYEDWLTGK